jgi:hypothetical protein
MAQFVDILISGGDQTTGSTPITENQIAIQINYHGLDSGVDIIPLQSIDNVNWVGFPDEKDAGVVWHIGYAPSTRALGSRIETLNGVRCKYLKLNLRVRKATTGEIDLMETY